MQVMFMSGDAGSAVAKMALLLAAATAWSEELCMEDVGVAPPSWLYEAKSILKSISVEMDKLEVTSDKWPADI